MTDKKIEPNDWRRQGQENYLKGAALRKTEYTPYRTEWDHDHCEFCGIRFSFREGDLKTGYTTADHYHWICESCFNDFKDEFSWVA